MGPEIDDLTDAKDVLRDEESQRVAAFGRATTILASLGVVVILLRSLTWTQRATVLAPVVSLALVGAYVWWRSHDGHGISKNLLRVFGTVCAVCALALIYALGVFTPIVAIFVLGLAFFVSHHDRRFASVMAAIAIAGYVLLALLVTVGVLPDTGLWKNPRLQQHISMTVIVGSVMVIQLLITRSSRRALYEAVARGHAAMRVAQTREAQLDEVRENLDVALRAGNAGRLTGQTLGRYLLGNIVGRGAMGEVYAARSDASERVAVKVLRAVGDDDLAQRFVREAEIAQKVRGPNLVEVRDTGRGPAGDLYIVMELLEGQDLAAILRDRTNLPLDEVVSLVESTAKGLELLHGAGVIHRDLKPQNLFLPSSTLTEWKILDYGVSKLVGADTMTKGDLVGTPGYMSPEQAESKDIDARSDVFSLGAVAYRALTGRRPFGGADMPAILYQVVHGNPTRPKEIVPDIPRAIEEVLAKALAKKRDDRYATAVDFAIAFRRAAQPGPAEEEAPTATTQVRPSWSKIATGKTGRKRPPWRNDPTTLTLPPADAAKPKRP
ncbi:MAG: serine/threonine protein kinase [Labilithrix sp.]|nr:serine/threonine protein kinase [Labilithrix sp.]MCW5811112.1 serine/threonine protein kinase [Labilithrix sp.]